MDDWWVQAVNHGITQELIDEVIKVSNDFFRLPLEEKEKYSVRPEELQGYGRLDFSLPSNGSAQTRLWNDVLRHNIRPISTVTRDRIPTKPEAYRYISSPHRTY